jgi:hypothetical protein
MMTALWRSILPLGVAVAQVAAGDGFPVPRVPYAPRTYVCLRAPERPAIDGRLDDAAWRSAAWTEPFVDIEGPLRPAPRHGTRAKMLWDDDHLYLAAALEEPDVWATLRERDSVIYQDNNFEVFLDPDGDSHRYYELEVNALGTVWDLLLLKPYRDTLGAATTAWDVAGLQVAVAVDGTLNRPGDVDRGWSVEVALPWRVLREFAPGKRPPAPGEHWRVNFSRVEWRLAPDGASGYRKLAAAPAERPVPDNWAWSPQGLVDMHYPEMWGFVQFSAVVAGSGGEAFRPSPDEPARWALRQLYYRQRDHLRRTGRYARRVEELGLGPLDVPGFRWPPEIEATRQTYEASLTRADGSGRLFVFQDGRLCAGAESCPP